MKLLVCGCRHVYDRALVFQALDQLREDRELVGEQPIGLVIHGDARGADTLAGDWARARGLSWLAMPADWNVHGRAAGPIRNQKMLEEGPDLVIAFWDGFSSGTYDMIQRAVRGGVQVVIIPVPQPTQKHGPGKGQ